MRRAHLTRGGIVAAAFIRNHTAGSQSNTGSQTASATLAAAVPAGRTLVAFCGNSDASQSGAPTTISKPAGESASWSQVGTGATAVVSTGGQYVTVTMWIIKTTVQWASGTAVTADWGSLAPNTIGIMLSEFSGVGAQADVQTSALNNNNAQVTTTVAAAPANGIVLTVGAAYVGTPADTYGGTATGTLQALGTLNPAFGMVASAFLVTGAGSRSATMTLSNRQKAMIEAAFAGG